MGSRCTIKEIARELGIAHSTVSRVLNNAPSAQVVSEATRQRIKEAVTRLGYVPNVNARRLVRARSNLLGIVLPASDLGQPARPTVADRSLGETIAGIAAVANANDYRLMLVFNDQRFVARKDYITLFKEKALDGMIVWGARPEEEYWHEAAGLNIVMVNTKGATAPPFAYVGSDNAGAARNICLSLVAKRCRRIAYLDGYEGLSISEERFAGYCQGLAEAGLPFRSELCFRGRGAEQCLARLLEYSGGRPEAFDAVQCVNDTLAAACGGQLLARGARIPETVKLSGGDRVDDPYALPLAWHVPMLSFRPAFWQMGKVAAEWALGKTPRTADLLLPVELIDEYQTPTATTRKYP